MFRPDLGPGRSIKYHQKMIIGASPRSLIPVLMCVVWAGNQTLLNPEPKIHEEPFAELKRAFERENRRTCAYSTAALDPSHLPQTPAGATTSAARRG